MLLPNILRVSLVVAAVFGQAPRFVVARTAYVQRFNRFKRFNRSKFYRTVYFVELDFKRTCRVNRQFIAVYRCILVAACRHNRQIRCRRQGVGGIYEIYVRPIRIVIISFQEILTFVFKQGCIVFQRPFFFQDNARRQGVCLAGVKPFVVIEITVEVIRVAVSLCRHFHNLTINNRYGNNLRRLGCFVPNHEVYRVFVCGVFCIQADVRFYRAVCNKFRRTFFVRVPLAVRRMAVFCRYSGKTERRHFHTRFRIDTDVRHFVFTVEEHNVLTNAVPNRVYRNIRRPGINARCREVLTVHRKAYKFTVFSNRSGKGVFFTEYNRGVFVTNLRAVYRNRKALCRVFCIQGNIARDCRRHIELGCVRLFGFAGVPTVKVVTCFVCVGCDCYRAVSHFLFAVTCANEGNRVLVHRIFCRDFDTAVTGVFTRQREFLFVAVFVNVVITKEGMPFFFRFGKGVVPTGYYFHRIKFSTACGVDNDKHRRYAEFCIQRKPCGNRTFRIRNGQRFIRVPTDEGVAFFRRVFGQSDLRVHFIFLHTIGFPVNHVGYR